MQTPLHDDSLRHCVADPQAAERGNSVSSKNAKTVIPDADMHITTITCHVFSTILALLVLGIKQSCQQGLLAWYMSANAEGKADDSAGSATVSDGNDTVQHPVNTSSVVIVEQMTCSVTCKLRSS